jgi:hypothetical protein
MKQRLGDTEARRLAASARDDALLAVVMRLDEMGLGAAAEAVEAMRTRPLAP